MSRPYFVWLYRKVVPDGWSYRKLLGYLDSVDFTYTLPMDGNRAEDGVNLRYRFGKEMGYDQRVIASLLDGHPCSVLEMMAALALRCEEQFMHDEEFGDRTGVWFMDFLTSMGLAEMDDEHFDARRVRTVVHRFLNREYASNGQGGLVTIENSDRDLRTVEIWYQVCWHLDEIIYTEKGRYL